MRKFQLTLLCFICLATSYGQTATKNFGRVDVEIIKEKKKKIYIKVDTKTTFPTEDSSLVLYLEKNLQSIQIDKRVKKGKYVISVQFIIDKEGYVSDVKCLNDPVGFGMEEEVMRVVKKYSMWPNWRPSPRPVRSYRTSSSTPGRT
jgi:hypothetical protein